MFQDRISFCVCLTAFLLCGLLIQGAHGRKNPRKTEKPASTTKAATPATAEPPPPTTEPVEPTTPEPLPPETTEEAIATDTKGSDKDREIEQKGSEQGTDGANKSGDNSTKHDSEKDEGRTRDTIDGETDESDGNESEKDEEQTLENDDSYTDEDNEKESEKDGGSRCQTSIIFWVLSLGLMVGRTAASWTYLWCD